MFVFLLLLFVCVVCCVGLGFWGFFVCCLLFVDFCFSLFLFIFVFVCARVCSCVCFISIFCNLKKKMVFID